MTLLFQFLPRGPARPRALRCHRLVLASGWNDSKSVVFNQTKEKLKRAEALRKFED
jgi:hypothetical protein